MRAQAHRSRPRWRRSPKWMRKLALYAALLGLVCLGLLPLLGASRAPSSLQAGKRCTSDACHQTQRQFPHLHGSPQKPGCVGCHKPLQPTQHRFGPAQRNCLSCHKSHAAAGWKGRGWRFVHGPVAVGACLTCHDPHGSKVRGLLRAAPEKLCLTCHHDLKQEGDKPPSKEGGRTSPNNPRPGTRVATTTSASKLYPGRLSHTTKARPPTKAREERANITKARLPVATKTSASRLYPGRLSHTTKARPPTRARAARSSQMGVQGLQAPGRRRQKGLLPQPPEANVPRAKGLLPQPHPPFAAGKCLSCHDPHGATQKHLLRKKSRQLCLSCHKKVATQLKRSRVHHGALLHKEQCLNCHAGHQSRHGSLLVRRGDRLCLQCHDRTRRSHKGRVLTNIAKALRKGRAPHGSRHKLPCLRCHLAHGSPHARLLVKAHPGALYASFQTSRYALCFSCHKAQLATQKQTLQATKFRNGALNLHALHVRRKKGRSCRFCHRAHGSSRPHLLRDKVQFGRWSLPIGVRLRAGGGSCSPACHAPREYHRTKPVSKGYRRLRHLLKMPPTKAR